MTISTNTEQAPTGRTSMEANQGEAHSDIDVGSAKGDSTHQAVLSAREAATYWSRTRLTDRQLAYRNFVTELRHRSDDLASLLASETHQSITDSRQEIEDAAGYFLEAIGESNAFYGHVYPHGAEAITASFLQYTVNEPLGVVAVIMDDESPARSFAYQVASTLLVGNTVVVSAGPVTPLTVRRLVKLLHEAGVPHDALQVLPTGDNASTHLASSSLINGLSIHGTSEEVIRATEAARANLTRVVALGSSNDAVIVFDDADLGLAAEEIIRAGFNNAGQNRASVKRVIVQETVRSQVTQLLVAAVDTLTHVNSSSPASAPTLVSREAAEMVERQIAGAVTSGARILIGGTVAGATVAPTILDLADEAAALARAEIIRGPVLAIVGFADDAQAYAVANASPYGFGVGVFTSSIQRAGTAAARVESSVVVVNGAGDYRSRRIPFGGVKKSGTGTESLTETARATTEIKTILAADIYDFAAINEENVAGRHT